MLAKNLPGAQTASRLDRRTETKSRQVVGGLRFDWVMAILVVWLIGGIHVDGWAHQHVPSLETFFTPWHALFYSAFGVIACFLTINLLVNHFKRGYAWTKALPAGYELSFIGVVLFMFGGVGDMLWHTILGIEVNVEALLSPTHLLLAIGGFLIASGPFRAAWKRAGGSGFSLPQLLPMLLSITMTFSIFTFFTQYGHPFGTTFAAKALYPGTARTQELYLGDAMLSYMLQSAILMGVTLLLMRRWSLPFGSLTVLYTINIFLIAYMRDLHLTTGILPLVLVALATGLVADLMVQFFKPSPANRLAFRVFAFAVPVVLYGLYFLALVVAGGGIWWTNPTWTGSIFLGAIAGLLTSYLVLPPIMPSENGVNTN